jgi:Peptidase family M13
MTITTMKLQLRRKSFIKVAWIYVSHPSSPAVDFHRLMENYLRLSLSLSFHAEQIRKIGDQPLRDILKTLGGWPVIESNWKPPNRSIENLMGTLRSDYSEPVLIELYVGTDDKNSSLNVLQVRRKNFPHR